MIDEEVSRPIIVAFYKVYNQTGCGFLEILYQRCLVIALRNLGLLVETEVPISILYDGVAVGDYRLDLVVNGESSSSARPVIEFCRCMSSS